MSQQYDNTNSGALFKNDKKTTERHPDRSGQADIACPECGAISEFWVAGWLKIAKRTQQRFMTLAFTPKDKNMPQNQAAKEDDFDDDIPF